MPTIIIYLSKCLIISVFFTTVFGSLLKSLSDILHLPRHKLTAKEREEIKEQGLIHFTKEENVTQIIEQGFIARVSDFSKIESKKGKLVWFYLAGNDKWNNEQLKRVKRVKKKKGKCSYNTGILVSNVTEDELNRIRMRKGFLGDNAIVYFGNFSRTNNIQKWNPSDIAK